MSNVKFIAVIALELLALTDENIVSAMHFVHLAEKTNTKYHWQHVYTSQRTGSRT